MGWFGIYGNFESVADYAEQELAITNVDRTMLDRAIVNNYVFTLVQMDDESTYILIDRVKRDGKYWSHQPMDESWGPNNYDCPERILARSTSQHPRALVWRERCRQHRRDKAARKRLVNQLRTNMIIKSKYFGQLQFVTAISNTKIVCIDTTGSRYAYPLRDFSVDELENAIK